MMLSLKFKFDKEKSCIFEYVQPLIAAVINGIHGTIFAYGQTGSGKTHTMIGSGENLGIIPCAIEMIFIALNEETKNRKDNFKFNISCTVLQIYCEKTYDLLNGNEKIEIHSSDILKSAKEVEVKSSNECMKILKRGLEQRKVSGTSMNETSSRSHAIFILTLKTQYFKENKKHERISRLNMVDLAGSESRKHTDNNKTQNFEALNINKSLLTLGQVIRSIINSIPKQVIPYRDSKLTMILRDSLGGNSKTTVIVNIHSNSKYAAETISTLNFAVNVKKVKNTAILQEFITSKETFTLKAEVHRLGEENDKLKTELAKEKEINQTVGEKVVQLQRIVDEKNNKINTLEKELKAAKDFIFQFENQNESFELEEDKSKLELELEKANEKQKKCEVEIAQMKQRIGGLENQNKQLKEKVFPTDERIPSGEESDSKENEMPIQIKASPGESYKTNHEIAQTNHLSQSNHGANEFSEFSEFGNLLGGGGAGGMPDIGSLMNDPQMMQAAEQIMNDPNMQNLMDAMMEQFMGGSGYDFEFNDLLAAGQSMAQQMKQANPELVEQLVNNFLETSTEIGSQNPLNPDNNQQQ